MAVNATPEEEAIIKKRYLTQTAATQANALPPFKKLTKRQACLFPAGLIYSRGVETGPFAPGAHRPSSNPPSRTPASGDRPAHPCCAAGT